ncbi:MAG: hypothetical protein ACPIA7_02955 [Akkermansiaceae bacterium]
MSDNSEKHMLRFGCPECGTRLVVDPSLAGKEGPCPSCGEVIIAPPIVAATSLVAKAGDPVEIKPREVGRKAVATGSSSSKRSEMASASDVAPGPRSTQEAIADRRRGRRRSGAVSPELGVSAVAGASAPSANKVSGTSARKISADTSISQKATESKDLKTLMLMVLITCIVVCIALGVYYYMTIGE